MSSLPWSYTASSNLGFINSQEYKQFNTGKNKY